MLFELDGLVAIPKVELDAIRHDYRTDAETVRLLRKERDDFKASYLRAINERDESRAENTELREKLASAEKDREEWKAESKRNAANAAKANEAWAKLNETVQGQLKKSAEAENDLDSCKSTCDQLRDSNGELRAELARLKSHEGQWAITCDGMTEGEAKKMAKNLIQYRQGGPSQCCYAVPLHAEDGPWVLRYQDFQGI